MTPLVQTVKPHMSVFICGNPQFIITAIRTFLHKPMEVKTVLNLETNARCLCKDTVTNAEEVRKRNYQKVFYPVVFEMGDDTASSNRILDCLSGNYRF